MLLECIIAACAVFALWVEIVHAEHLGSNMTPIVLAIANTVLFGVMLWRVRVYIEAARDASSVRVAMVTLRDDHKTQMDGLRLRFAREAGESRASHQKLFDAEKIELENRLKMDHDQALAILRMQWSSKYGALCKNILKLNTAASCEWLARDADSLLSRLKLIRQVLDKDLDGVEMEASNRPLRCVFDSKRAPVEWTETHLAVFAFQSLYTHHITTCNQLSGTLNGDFVTEHSVSEGDPNTVEQVVKGLEDHRENLKGHAATLRLAVDNETIS